MSSVMEHKVPKAEQANYGLTVADAVWIAAAISQRSSQLSGEIGEGVDIELLATTVQCLSLTLAERQSIVQHIRQHCVANKEPQPNRSCVLFATDDRHRRLYRIGDPRHPAREGAPTHPKWERLPQQFKDLQDWYESVWNSPSALIANDPLLNAIGTGNEIWRGISPDAYVNELRDAWGDRG
jgi:hypothetical protein